MDSHLRTIRRCRLVLPILAAALLGATRHPLPEYTPVQAILVSEDLFNYPYGAEALVSAVTAAGAEVWIATDKARPAADVDRQLAEQGVAAAARRHVKVFHLPHGNIWMRDYGPLPIVDASGRLRFLDFVYADPSSRANDEFPQVEGRALGVPVESVPVELDGGNFLTNGELCFTSAADLPLSKESSDALALTRYSKQLGCARTMVVRDPPHAHLDMWAKIVSEHRILVNELDERTLARVKEIYGHVPPELKQLKHALDLKAQDLSRYFEVVRLPMPMPYRGTFRTYANAALVNGHALVPSFKHFGWHQESYPDADLEPYYEERAAAVYKASGYDVSFLEADGLAFNGGAWRCVTSPIPMAAKGH